MRQYCPWRWIIVINICALWLIMPAGSSFAAESSLPDYLWNRQAAAARMQQQAAPPVDVQPLTIDGNLLKTQIRVHPWFDDNSIDFILAVPAGEITSATIMAHELVNPREVAPNQADDVTSAVLAPREHTARVEHMAFVRGHRLIRIRIPAVVAGSFGSRLKSGQLIISFEEPIAESAAARTDAGTSTGPVIAMLEKLVVNPQDLGRFAVPLIDVPLPDHAGYAPPLGSPGSAVASFETTQSEFMRFTGADLAACGVNLGQLDRDSVSVWTNGEQQPVLVSSREDSGGGIVGPTDQFTIYARENLSTYTATRVYWVRTDAPARPMKQAPPTVSASAAPLSTPPDHFISRHNVEQDIPPVLTRNDQFLSILDFRWVWWTWTPAGPGADVPSPREYDKPGQITFDLPGLAGSSETAPMTFHFYAHHWKMTDTPISVDVQVNGRPVGQLAISDGSGLTQTLQVPSNILRTASNTAVLIPQITTGTATLPDLCFDRLEIDYPRTYQMTSSTLEFHPPSDAGGVVTISAPGGVADALLIADITTTDPAVLSGAPGKKGQVAIRTNGPATRRYLAVQSASIKSAKLTRVDKKDNLRAPETTADVIVIAWPEFIPDMKPWVDRKTAVGHAVKVVDINDVYDQFGYGHASPYAIREFLRYAATRWQGSPAGPAASAVLLVGDSTSAYRGEFRNGVINYVPTMRLSVGGDVFASDQWYVGLFGDDVFADALIGRFSVNSIEDLRNVIQKQIDYETSTAPAPWHNTLGFIADHSEFEATVDRVMQQVVPPRFFLDRIMMSELPWIDNYYFPREIADAQQAKVSPAATGRIRDMFNSGASVVTYFGHGSPNIWSTERMWFGGDSPNSDNLLLTNRDRLSIVINMTCNSGAIDYPQPRWNVCISEDFMRVPNGGAVACFVPSGPGLTVQHERLMMEVGKSLFGSDAEALGQSMQLALWRYLAEGNPEELARMYILLGDPLLMPHISKPVPASEAVPQTATQWAGTVLLPPDIAASHSGGNFQFNTYDDHIDPGAVASFTSSTVALPLPPEPARSPPARAVALSVPASTGTLSTFQPVSSARAVNLLQWRRIDSDHTSALATLEIRLRNDSPLPVRSVHVEIVTDSENETAAKSDPTSLQPYSDATVRIKIPVSSGLQKFRAVLVSDTSRRDLKSEVPIALAGLRPDTMRDSIPPAVVDPRSVSVRYRKSADGITATVSASIYALALEPLSNLRIGIEGPDDAILQPSIVNVPPMGPGENAQVSMNVTLPPGAPDGSYAIRFDPAGFYPEFARFPTENLTLGQSQFPDLMVQSVTPTNPGPTDGQTVFFDVTTINQGHARMDGVRVEGFHVTTSGTEKLKSQVMLQPPVYSLVPGESKTVRLRWDPYRNAGQNKLRFTALSSYEMPDSNPENNSKEITLDVRTKARLVPVTVGPIRPTAEDKAARQVRFLARVRNDGETEIHGLRVLFYSSPAKTDETYLGDADLDSVAPGETRDVIFTYKFKPEEIHRPINITFEVMYKGSRQRLLH